MKKLRKKSFVLPAGLRPTKTRLGLIALLERSSPLSAPDLKERLERNGHRVNKTTVYRELELLLEKKVICEIILRDGIKRYELASEEHGHHLVCLSCHKIERVALADELSQQELKISREKKFKILNHSLEFYGLCRGCS